MSLTTAHPTIATVRDRPASRILVVDDNTDNRDVLVRRLGKLGFQMCEADGGRSALMAVETDTPDLVLLDHMMPDMSGLEVLKILRSGRTLMELPVIMVTALISEDMAVAALAAGANDYITKPISFPILLARVNAQLARQTAEAELRIANMALDKRMTERKLEVEDMRSELEQERNLRKLAETEISALKGAPRLASEG